MNKLEKLGLCLFMVGILFFHTDFHFFAAIVCSIGFALFMTGDDAPNLED